MAKNNTGKSKSLDPLPSKQELVLRPRFLKVGFPSDRTGKYQIVAEVEARITAIDHLEAELERQIIRSKRLRQSTLGAGFSGNPP